MNKKTDRKKLRCGILTVVGIMAGCLLVFAGYRVMQQLLEKRQSVLLSQSGTYRTVGNDEDDTSSGADEERTPLTGQELESVLLRMSFGTEENLHEPYGKQMSMQEAIETGQTWVEDFCSSNSFPSAGYTVSFEQVSARLFTRQIDKEMFDAYYEDMTSEDVYIDIEKKNEDEMLEKGAAVKNQLGENAQTADSQSSEPGAEISVENKITELSESMYGCWQVEFSAADMTVSLLIHAVSGQILQANIDTVVYADAVARLNLRQIQEKYIESLSLEGEFETEEYGDYCCRSIYRNQLVAYVEKTAYPTEEDLGGEDAETIGYVSSSVSIGVY